MLRTLLVGILAVSAATSCKGGSDAPAVTPGAPVGKVLELAGKVTATRGTDVRTLVPGGEISADDVIGTAADGRVVILVAHNNARWDLGPNKQAKVGDSLAWTAAKQDRPAATVDEEPSAAGRHAEKAAGTTDTTTAENERNSKNESARAEPAAIPAADSPPPPAQAPVPTAASSEPPPPPPPPPPPKPSEEARQDDQLVAPARDPAAVTQGEAMKDKKAADKGKGQNQDLADQGDGNLGMPPPRTGAGPKSPKPGPRAEPELSPSPSLEVRRTILKERDALRACLETPTLVVAITVVDGKYTITTPDAAATPKVRACLAKVGKRLAATRSTEPVTIKLNLAK